MKPSLSMLAIAFALCLAPGAQAEDPANGWGELRRDVESSQARPGPGPDMQARRKAMRERAHARFAEADADGSGALSSEEMQRLNPDWAQHFSLIDDDRNGQVTELELAQAWKRRQAMRRGGMPPYRPAPR
jgi:hypothetical protein